MIILAQSDTTAGFFSTSHIEINMAKKREIDQRVICLCNSLSTLKSHTRIPSRFKSMVRNSQKTSFIYPNKMAFRVVRDKYCLDIINKYGKNGIIYSSSANLHNQKFDLNVAMDIADITISTPKIEERKASKIYKISNSAIRQIR